MSASSKPKLGIVGAGAWGTALATVATRAEADTLVWAREPEVVGAINDQHENTPFLPGIRLSEAIRATGDHADLADRDMLLVVTPAQAMRAVLADLAPHIGRGIPLILCAKGIERDTGKLMSAVLEEAVPGANGLILSGPSFAVDVARGLPTAVTLAGPDAECARAVAEAISIPAFRPYFSNDIVGAQVGGALKNVLAIACGIVDGRNLGASARAALTTRGFAELSRFGALFGARPETLHGLSGLGDLILTCNSPQSRNMSLGIELGRGRTVNEVLGARASVSEGVYTARVVVEIARRKGIDMPISTAVHEIVEGSVDVDGAIERLLTRPIRAED